MIAIGGLAKDRVGDPATRARIWQLTGFACCTLLVLGVLLAWSVDRDRISIAEVEHTQSVLGALESYTGQILSAETGQRGYLLTGQNEYLVPYENAVADSSGRLEQLRRLIADPNEARDVLRLSAIFKAKLQELARTVQLAKAGNRAGAMAIVREGSGRRRMVEFQELSQAIAGREATLLAVRQTTAGNETADVQIGMTIGGLLSILLIIGAGARTMAVIEARSRLFLLGIAAIAEGRRESRVGLNSRDAGGRIAVAFNEMGDRLQATRLAQERVEADLALSNAKLQAEVIERTAAQASLLRSVTELRRSNEELDNFAYGASHDLKAPLRGIRNLAEWITEDVRDSAEEATLENLSLLRNRVERLDLLLDSLLQYSRVGRTGGTPEDIELAKLVDDIGDYLAPRPGFSVKWRGDILSIRTNKAPLEQVLRNLIGNGLKHHDRDRGSVVVSARDMGDAVEFRVEDDGPGIAPGFHERVFQMFQTLKSRDEVEGSGMGLAIAKKSIECHGGVVGIESAPPQRGTAFVFTWKKDRLALAA
jgi:signal transduction histidine kinase